MHISIHIHIHRKYTHMHIYIHIHRKEAGKISTNCTPCIVITDYIFLAYFLICMNMYYMCDQEKIIIYDERSSDLTFLIISTLQ